ncbi:predicted protein [Botrytis cinerea T4]|uniref:Uncharacterized protein n=1 Tax=Botryotinia fuckeliana (strain T4) TaxID=999810 RepID=G2YHS3_BOTF4|nr:predicted protein [Botrytis cinerea T4]
MARVLGSCHREDTSNPAHYVCSTLHRRVRATSIVQLPSKIDFVIVIKYVMVLMWRMSIPNIVKLY